MTHERPLVFECNGDRLVGVVHVPAEPARVGVVIVVGGPQVRAGSHRQFVRLAREVAAAGYACLRFDVRGMGDSDGSPRKFDALDDDISAAIATLRREIPFVRRIVLAGLCDGASAALLYWYGRQDQTICGFALANPWVRSDVSLARTHLSHYYTRRLVDPQFWRRLVSGRIGFSALRGLFRSIRLANQSSTGSGSAKTFQDRMALAWRTAHAPILLQLSGNDYTALEFLEHTKSNRGWNGLLECAYVTRHDLKSADHTFSSEQDLRASVDQVVRWLVTLA